MATGTRAFQGKSQISVASAILEKDPDAVSTTKPQTPAAFDYLVAACLAKDREERVQTAQDVRIQLRVLRKPRQLPLLQRRRQAKIGKRRRCWELRFFC